MSVDWSKAPEGATHFQPKRADDDFWHAVFWKIVDGVGVEAWQVSNDTDALGHYTRPTWTAETMSLLISRPWSGEGLPPVGVICEFRTGPGMSWSKGQVLAFGGKKVFYQDYGSHEWSRLYDEIEFRPIRTPEQIAADERELAITDICVVMDKDPSRPILREKAGVLYDAGYRKQVAP